MDKIEQNFYKYTVRYYEEIDGKHELKTASGLTFGKNFNEACAKIIDYFGEESLEDIKIEFASDCDVIEDFEIAELFKMEEKKQEPDEQVSEKDIRDKFDETMSDDFSSLPI